MQAANKSPKIVIRKALAPNSPAKLRRGLVQSPSERREPLNLRPFYWECFTHSLIMIYGVVILIFTFYNPLNPAK